MAKGGVLVGTVVYTKERVQKPIEEIRIKDKIFAYHPNRKKQATVMRVYQGEVDEILEVVLRYLRPLPYIGTDIQRLFATEEHVVWLAEGGWESVGQLELGVEIGRLMLKSYGPRCQRCRLLTASVEQIIKHQGDFKVYDLEVDPFNTFFANTVIVRGGGDEKIS